MERRESKYKCPRCQENLVELWGMQDADRLTGGREIVRLGDPICPNGHQIEFNNLRQPIIAR